MAQKTITTPTLAADDTGAGLAQLLASINSNFTDLYGGKADLSGGTVPQAQLPVVNPSQAGMMLPSDYSALKALAAPATIHSCLTNYTVTVADAGIVLYYGGSAAITITLPATMPAGRSIRII